MSRCVVCLVFCTLAVDRDGWEIVYNLSMETFSVTSESVAGLDAVTQDCAQVNTPAAEFMIEAEQPVEGMVDGADIDPNIVSRPQSAEVSSVDKVQTYAETSASASSSTEAAALRAVHAREAERFFIGDIVSKPAVSVPLRLTALSQRNPSAIYGNLYNRNAYMDKNIEGALEPLEKDVSLDVRNSVSSVLEKRLAKLQDVLDVVAEFKDSDLEHKTFEYLCLCIMKKMIYRTSAQRCAVFYALASKFFNDKSIEVLMGLRKKAPGIWYDSLHYIDSNMNAVLKVELRTLWA